jgi:hypothetical protein
LGLTGFDCGFYFSGGDVMIICDPVEDVTMQQVLKYAELHKLPLVFNDFDVKPLNDDSVKIKHTRG